MTQKLSQAEEPVRIVCFGDSITGRYYHSGGRRAWPDMLQLALGRLYPTAQMEVINAGVSGNTSAQGLARMQRDVLNHNPHLVLIMFGMNDLAYGTVTAEQDVVKKAAFVANLETMVANCRAVNAEVVLCTQNPVYLEAAPARPPERVKEFASLICQAGVDLGVPVVDVYTEWETLRATDLSAWRLLMSETIHPSMAGHKRIAEQVAEMISGSAVSLADVLAEQPVCGGFIARLKDGKPVTLAAPASLTAYARAMVLRRFPDADLTVVSLSEKVASLDALVGEYKAIRTRKPDFVLVSLPSEVLKIGNEEAFIRQTSWVVNWTLPFGGSAWTAVGVDPALVCSGLTPQQSEGAELMREIVRGHDLDWISQPPGASIKLQDALDQWFDGQVGKGQ